MANKIPHKSPLPPRFCNLDRLLTAMKEAGLDGLVVHTRPHVFYLSGFSPPSVQSLSETSPLAAVFLSIRDPEHPLLVVPEFELSYFVDQPTWIQDIRPYAGNILPLDIPVEEYALDRFLPQSLLAEEWVQLARKNYATGLIEASRTALRDLGLDSGRVGFDNLRFAHRLQESAVEVVDAFDVLKYARMVKTEEELVELRKAAWVNQTAIERTVKQWEEGATWRQVAHTYHHEVLDLGGFVNEPAGLVIANPSGTDRAFTLSSGREDPEIVRGMSVMFDCHGTYNHYCWDGGKTWIVDDEPPKAAKRVADAVEQALGELHLKLRGNLKVSEIQALVRGVFRKCQVPDPDSLMVFFHGLGLDHQDQVHATDVAWADWTTSEGMLLATHILYPGDDLHRYWLEDISHVRSDGAESLFTWDASHL